MQNIPIVKATISMISDDKAVCKLEFSVLH